MPVDIQGLLRDPDFFKLSPVEMRELVSSLSPEDRLSFQEAIRTAPSGPIAGFAHPEGPDPLDVGLLGLEVATAPSLARLGAGLPRAIRIRNLAKQVAEKEALRPESFNLPVRTLPEVEGRLPPKTLQDIISERLGIPTQRALPAPSGPVTSRPMRVSEAIATEIPKPGAIHRLPPSPIGEGEFAGRTVKEIGIESGEPRLVQGSLGSSEFLKLKIAHQQAKLQAEQILKRQKEVLKKTSKEAEKLGKEKSRAKPTKPSEIVQEQEKTDRLVDEIMGTEKNIEP